VFTVTFNSSQSRSYSALTVLALSKEAIVSSMRCLSSVVLNNLTWSRVDKSGKFWRMRCKQWPGFIRLQLLMVMDPGGYRGRFIFDGGLCPMYNFFTADEVFSARLRLEAVDRGVDGDVALEVGLELSVVAVDEGDGNTGSYFDLFIGESRRVAAVESYFFCFELRLLEGTESCERLGDAMGVEAFVANDDFSGGDFLLLVDVLRDGDA
jgi:hypothetical protein